MCNAQWQLMSDPLLPHADYHMACGVYNNSIFLIGGWITDRDVMEYKITTDEMVDHDTSQYSPSTHGIENVGFYFQSNNMLYIQQREDVFYKMDMTTNQFWTTTVAIPYPMHDPPVSRQCVTGNDQYLVMSGGFKGGTSVYVMFLSDHSWTNGSSMQNERLFHGCCFVSNFFYVIGGNKRTIEKIRSTQIITTSEQWSVLPNQLTAPGSSRACIVPYLNDIWVIGHATLTTDPAKELIGDYVQVIHTIDGTVELLPERLPYNVFGANSALVDGVLYVFGGRDYGGTPYTTWLKYELYTRDPSLAPTNLTETPSQHPTTAPTLLPSMNLTFTPTSAPTLHPTSNPSASPTRNPSEYPTKTPTWNPALIPTIMATLIPTLTLTINSVKAVTAGSTLLPTHSPTDNPSASSIIGVIAAAVVLFFVFIYLYRRYKIKKMKEIGDNMEDIHSIVPGKNEQKSVDDVYDSDVDNAKTVIDGELNCEMSQRDNTQGLVQISPLNPVDHKYGLDGKATAGETREGLDVVMADDEFEVIGDNKTPMEMNDGEEILEPPLIVTSEGPNSNRNNMIAMDNTAN
eukprot:575109_1